MEISHHDKISEYRLRTVTYCVEPVPFFTPRPILQLAKEGGHKYPLATSILLNGTIIDDIC